jgi:phage-related protein
LGSEKILQVRFYATEPGHEPVREWLKDLPAADKRIIGIDLMKVEMGWPIGMPTCRSLAGTNGLLEVRSNISDGRIARILFVIDEGYMVLLHGFVKKAQQTPQRDIALAQQRRRTL